MVIAHSTLKKHVHHLMAVLQQEGLTADNKEALDRIAHFLGTKEGMESVVTYIRTHPKTEETIEVNETCH